jgi:hypothetical protein
MAAVTVYEMKAPETARMVRVFGTTGKKRESCCLARICTERVRFTSVKEDPRAISIKKLVALRGYWRAKVVANFRETNEIEFSCCWYKLGEAFR